MRSRGIAVIASAVLITSGCDVALPQRAQIRFVSPSPMAESELPLELRWEADHIPPGGFAVFVDRAPLATGRSLRSLADRERDEACLARAACPDEEWLRARRVYLTQSTTVTVDVVDDARGSGGVHRISVIPLDAEGRRDSEMGASIEIVVKARE
jgi:hypothetical protein